MFDDCTAVTKMNSDKSKEDYAIHNGELEQKCFIAWSPLEENKFLFKHRYVSCSRSVPRRNKCFVRYRISRSLNFDTSVRSSSSENSSFEEDKHLSRSAKIMRALNFNSSPSYYGKTKIKKSLNFNLTPSPKRFMPVRKSIRKSLSMNFKSPLSVSNKVLHFDDSPSDSANSNILFSSSESIDENQNETPLQDSTKEHEMLLYSTPNTKLGKKTLCSSEFTPLRSGLKETIDNIVRISATPNAQSLQRTKGRPQCTNGITMNTSRNLFYEFHDQEDDRPCTPENVIRIVPESMSAIKRSHKKERSSRRNGQCTSKFANDPSILQDKLTEHRSHNESFEDSKSTVNRGCNASSKSIDLSVSHSEDDMSDTGSLFDYTGEREYILKGCKGKLGRASNYDNIANIYKADVHVKADADEETSPMLPIFGENELLGDYGDSNDDGSDALDQDNDLCGNSRSVTPEPLPEEESEFQTTVTPENRINILQRVANDSIKKSHKKIKDNNKRRLFSPKVLQSKLEVAEKQENISCWQDVERSECIEDNKTCIEQSCVEAPQGKRSCTPEKLNSSRLLLSQFSSVKKSHKKDKHNKILSEFLKRQEYFCKDMDAIKSNRYKGINGVDASDCANSTGNSDLDAATNVEDYSISLMAHVETNASTDKLSPSKRKKTLDLSLDCEANVSSDSELQELEMSKEEFQIFTPLKRRRSIVASTIVKECLHFYDASSDGNEHSEDSVANVTFSRCLTPIPRFQSACVNREDTGVAAIQFDENVGSEVVGDASDCCTNDLTGRLTPRNMPTTELYVNLDSIKKSHKKNKRGNISRTGLSSVRNHFYVEGKSDVSMENVESDEPNDIDTTNESVNEKSIDHGNTSGSSVSPVIDNQKHSSPSMATNLLSNVTPPNCLKTKNYMRLLRETSIKRSHKKIREQKKQEFPVDADELSDDGSIFGDEEKLNVTGNQSTHE